MVRRLLREALVIIATTSPSSRTGPPRGRARADPRPQRPAGDPPQQPVAGQVAEDAADAPGRQVQLLGEFAGRAAGPAQQQRVQPGLGPADFYSGNDNYSAIYDQGAAGSTATVQTEVTGQQGMSSYAKAGIMVRNDIADTGTTPEGVILFESPAGGIQLEWDDNGGLYIDNVTPPNGTIADTVPVWLRLVRDGFSYTGYYSTDGSTWTEVGSATVPDQATTQVAGLFMTSHATSAPGLVYYGGFSITS